MKRVDELFDIRYGHGLSLNRLSKVSAPDGVNFVSRGVTQNGVSARVSPPEGIAPGQPGELTVALNGQGGALATFVQPVAFVTGYHVAILTPKSEMSVQEKLWWARCIWENHFRYGFGRQANRTLGALELPDSPPQWVERKAIPKAAQMLASAADHVALSDASNWRDFELQELFDIEKGTRLTKRDQQPGSTPYVGSSAVKNGITNMIDRTPDFEGHALTVPYNGSVGHAFYQPEGFCAGDDVHVLRPRGDVDKFALMFVAVIIRREKFRYGYGRKWHLGRMKVSKVGLPIDDAEAPDWSYMSRYMRGLKLSAAVEALS